MNAYRLGQVPRLARTLIGRILDQKVGVASKPGDLCYPPCTNLRIHSVLWRRKTVSFKGFNASSSAKVGFPGFPSQLVPAREFELSLARPTKELPLLVSEGETSRESRHSIAPPNQRAERLARMRSFPLALLACGKETRAILRLLKTKEPNESIGIQRRMGLINEKGGVFLPETLFGPQTVPKVLQTPAVVVPIFNGFDATKRLLDTLMSQPTIPNHLVLVDDASDDPRIQPLLEIANQHFEPNCTLLSLQENKGFVAAANAGLQVALSRVPGHVVLLNSDTLPPVGWLERLVAPLEANRKVASVTPVSNNAEILSVLGRTTSIPTMEAVTAIDAVAQKLSVDPVKIPTGVGFCMAMSRRFLYRIGVFDPAFGQGYGAEVDWCQRASRLGGQHVCLPSLFVGHEGAASFGAERRSDRLKKSVREIEKRYPDYTENVRSWCEDDPLAAVGLALSLAWLSEVSHRAVPIFIAHSLGGGAETALRSEIQNMMESGYPGAIIVRFGGPRLFRLEILRPSGVQIGEVANEGLLHDLLAAITRRRIIYSCGVGCPDPILVPTVLNTLSATADCVELRVHDYFMISPSWNLLNEHGDFMGEPTMHSSESPSRSSAMEDWRRAWGESIDRAGAITVFSTSSKHLITRAYPNAAGKVQVKPHRPAHLPQPVQPGGQTIGVLGSINQAKGGDVLMRLATQLENRRLVVVGEIDGRYALPPPHRVHGQYDPRQIEKLARAYDIGVWLMPSVCPETFSFTTHEMLATGLPVLAFNLGAQAEAVQAASNGVLLQAGPKDTKRLVAEIEGTFLSSQQDNLRKAS